MPRTLLALLIGVVVASGPSLNASQPGATSVQYTSPAGVVYRSLPDTDAIAKARAALDADPRNVARIIDLGVAQSGARQFREAIATFTRGLELEPNNALLLRWRGHRYLSIRDFDRAQADLTRGGAIDASIYGIWYHLGIVQFARGDFAAAAASFERAQPIAPDPGELAGSTDWLWMALSRAGRHADAKAMLDRRPESRMAPIDNAYTRRLKLYRGEIGPDAVITPADSDEVQVATLAFGLGNWHLIKGDSAKARAAFERSVRSTGGWPGFGFILSEVELQRNPVAAHWPRFRGPNSNPTAEHPNLPVSWSKTENVEWVTDVAGVGWSSPVVWGNRVFLTAAKSDTPMKPPRTGVDFSNEYLAELRKQGLSAADANKKLYERDREMPNELVISLVLYCYDLETGKQLWEREMYNGRPGGGRHSKNSFASETPVTDGERVYVYLTDYGLFAYDFAGKPVWTTPLKAHATTRDWGTGASPALYKDRLFVLNDNEEQSFVAAFDTRTGKELWRTPRTVQPTRKSGWSTPFVWEHRARTELVTLGPGVVISYGLDGAELWRMNRMGGYAIQSPFAWNDVLYVTSGAGGDDNRPIVAIRAGASGDITPPAAETSNAHVVWYDRAAGGTYLPTPVIYKNALYVLNDKGIFSRRNPETGERTYQSRVAPGAAAFTASPWAYNGHVFVMSEEGDTFVIEAGDEYRLVRTNSLDDFSMATPAIVGDRLLIRTQHHLYSIRNRR